MKTTFTLQEAIDEIGTILLVLKRGNAVNDALGRVLFDSKSASGTIELHAVASELYEESAERLGDLSRLLTRCSAPAREFSPRST